MEKVKLEFGNPEHIKLAQEGYRIAEALASNLEAEIKVSRWECGHCDGLGEVEIYYCSNCMDADCGEENPIELCYRKDEIVRNNLDPNLLDRCKNCLAKIIH